MDDVSLLEQVQMDADDQLPEVGSFNGRVWTWYETVKKVLRHWTAGTTAAPVAPTVVPIGHKIIRTATSMGWKRDGSLYFERRNGLLFMALTPGGEWRRVPDWAMIALQPAFDVEHLQSKKSLYIHEPGRKRDRKATPGETQMVVMVSLRRMGKKWEDIFAIVGVGRTEGEKCVEEIERVFRDVQQMAEWGKVPLSACHHLNPNWIRHSAPDVAKQLEMRKDKTPTADQYAERQTPEEAEIANSEVSC